LLPTAFPGVKTSRDEFLVSIDRDILEKRVRAYFDPHVSHGDMHSRFPTVMTATGRFDPIHTRDQLRKRGALSDHIVRYAYRPFDTRWLYWEPETKLLDEKRSEYWPHVRAGNQALVSQQRPRGECSRVKSFRTSAAWTCSTEAQRCFRSFL
jgi:Type ISP C-terminal specificity domain